MALQTLSSRVKSLFDKNKTIAQPSMSDQQKTLEANNKLFKVIDAAKKQEAPRSMVLQPNTAKFDAQTTKYVPIQRQQDMPSPGVSKASPIQEIKPLSTGFQLPDDFYSLAAKKKLNPKALTDEENAKLKDYSQQLYAENLRKQFSGESSSLDSGQSAQSGYLDAIQKQIADEEARVAEEEAKIKTREQQAIDQFRQNLDSRYAPQIQAIDEMGTQRKEDVKAMRSFQGFGRSTLTQEDIDNVNKSVADARAAVEAAKNQELQIYEAQQAGASSDSITLMQQALGELRVKAREAELEQNKLMDDARLKTQSTGQDISLDFLTDLQQEGVQHEIDTKASELAGFFIDKYGQPILDPDGQKMSIGQDGDFQLIQGENPLTGQPVVAGIFNKNTGEILGGNIGQGVPSAGSYGTQGTPTVGVTGVVEGGKVSAYGSSAWKPGLDISAPAGTPVRLPRNAEVIAVKNDVPDTLPGQGKGFGNQVKVRFDDGTEGWFSHLSSTLNTQVGQKLPEGTQIGAIGRTGFTMGKNGYHLDLTMKKPDGSYLTAKEVEGYISQPSSTLQQAGQNVDMSALAAQAMQAGYTDKFGIQTYIQAAQQGYQLPNKYDAEFERKLQETQALKTIDPTQGQLQAASAVNKMQLAESNIGRQIPEILKQNYLSFQSKLYLPTVAQPSWMQAYKQAGDDFINAKLRRESGAAISAGEFLKEAKIYLPLPGDSSEVLKQKAAAREQVMSSIRNEALGTLSINTPQANNASYNPYTTPSSSNRSGGTISQGDKKYNVSPSVSAEERAQMIQDLSSKRVTFQDLINQGYLTSQN